MLYKALLPFSPCPTFHKYCTPNYILAVRVHSMFPLDRTFYPARQVRSLYLKPTLWVTICNSQRYLEWLIPGAMSIPTVSCIKCGFLQVICLSCDILYYRKSHKLSTLILGLKIYSAINSDICCAGDARKYTVFLFQFIISPNIPNEKLKRKEQWCD